jgi:hypothetical protein
MQIMYATGTLPQQVCCHPSQIKQDWNNERIQHTVRTSESFETFVFVPCP